MAGRVGIDVGGTFTDGVIIDTVPHRVRRAKALTTPDNPVEGVRAVLAKLGVGATEAETLIHGTTVITNLLVERKGCRVGVLTTQGFRDVLEIQTSQRRDVYDAQWVKPEPLVPRYLRAELQERTLSDGTIQRGPDRDETLARTDELLGAGAEAIAICFLHSYANPDNEQSVGRWIAERHPNLPICLSSSVDPQIREYERFSTAVINVYAVPAIRSYVQELDTTLRRHVLFMHSGGGVLPAKAVADRPVKLVMSGPAAGVVAAQRIGLGVSCGNLITFDMGGTSTDVAVVAAGVAERASETELTWGIPIRAESLEIRSIGAGGGSIAARDPGGGLQVGPASAGAQPGPACYGRGGLAPTVTDANVLLGFLHPERFLGGQMALDFDAAHRAISRLASEFAVSPEEMAAGIHNVVNAQMAGLIRALTVNRGRDPHDFTMVAFGGAGGQHAYQVAELVGCEEVLFPRHSSTFSALGLVSADLRTTEARSMIRDLDSLDSEELEGSFAELEEGIRDNLLVDAASDFESRRQASVRYIGQTHSVVIDVAPGDDARSIYDRFQTAHLTVFGTKLDDPAEIVTLHATVTVAAAPPSLATAEGVASQAGLAEIPEWRTVPGFETEVRVFDAESLHLGGEISGPALIEDSDTTIVVPSGGHLVVGQGGSLRLSLRSEGENDGGGG